MYTYRIIHFHLERIRYSGLSEMDLDYFGLWIVKPELSTSQLMESTPRSHHLHLIMSSVQRWGAQIAKIIVPPKQLNALESKELALNLIELNDNCPLWIPWVIK